MHGALKHFGKNLVHEQEVMNNIAEMMMETYISESLALRVEKLETIRGNGALYRDMLDVNVFDTAEKVRKSATDAVWSFAGEESAPALVSSVEYLASVAGVNVKDSRRRIAGKLIEDNSYRF